MDLISQRSKPKLGDFGSLWELFDGSSPTLRTPETTEPELEKVQPSLEEVLSSSAENPAKKVSLPGPYDVETSVSASSDILRVNESNSIILKDTATDCISHSSRPNTQVTGIPINYEGRSFTILTRTSGHEPSRTSANVEFVAPISPVAIVRSGVGDPSDTPTVPKTRSRGKDFRHNTHNNPTASDESAGLDSDESIVFDNPIAHKPRPILFVPSQVNTTEAKTYPLDTPPSSFDDNDWKLNATAVKGLASGGINVWSTQHGPAAERRAMLMTRLLDHFPAYAKIVSQVGLASDPSDGIDSRPIHVFVDMSNVCFHIPSPQLFSD
jgi:hypothetical protein